MKDKVVSLLTNRPILIVIAVIAGFVLGAMYGQSVVG